MLLHHEKRTSWCGIWPKEVSPASVGTKNRHPHRSRSPHVFLKKTPEPVGQQGRWLDLLSEYEIDIKHHPGHMHSNSNALSRRPCNRSRGKDCQQCLRTIAGSGQPKPTAWGRRQPDRSNRRTTWGHYHRNHFGKSHMTCPNGLYRILPKRIRPNRRVS